MLHTTGNHAPISPAVRNDHKKCNNIHKKRKKFSGGDPQTPADFVPPNVDSMATALLDRQELHDTNSHGKKFRINTSQCHPVKVLNRGYVVLKTKKNTDKHLCWRMKYGKDCHNIHRTFRFSNCEFRQEN